MISERPDIPGLTGLRFVAAASVAVAHFSIPAGISIFGYYLSLSVLGMPLFFCLSGFVIHYVYATSLSDSWGHASGRFALARFSRIYPLFFFLLLYFLLFTPLGQVFSDRPWVAASYLGATGSWWYWTAGNISLPQLPYGWSWSISTEAFFYVAYVCGLYRISRITSPYQCLCALVGFCLLAYAILYPMFLYVGQLEGFILQYRPDFISSRTDFLNSFHRWLIYISPYFHLFEFIGGVLVCQLFLTVRQRRIEVSSFKNEVIAGFGVAWIGLFWGIYNYAIVHGQLSHGVQFLVWLHMTFLLVPGCLALILALALERCWLSRFLSARWAVFLGTVSYSIYLCHLMLNPLFALQPGQTYPWLRFAMALVMTAIVSAGLYLLVEAPAKQILRLAWTILSLRKPKAEAQIRPAK